MNCGMEPARAYYKYCSNACQSEFEYKVYIKKWLRGGVTGLQSLGIVSSHVKRYLRTKFMALSKRARECRIMLSVSPK